MMGLLTFHSLGTPYALTLVCLLFLPHNICPPTSLPRVPALSAFLYQPVHIIQQRTFLLFNHFAFFLFWKIL